VTRTLGLMAEYPGPDEVLAAARALRADGYRRMDAYVPYPVEGLEDALGFRRSWLNWAAGAAGTFGAAFAFWIQWVTNHRLFALNIGGRPSFAIPAFLIVVFETMVLFSGVTAFVLFFWTCRLPRLAHPLFRVPGFESASVDRFWLGVSADDDRFDVERTEAELRRLGALRIETARGVS
jgi:Protein of unknown function (DUF3341)